MHLHPHLAELLASRLDLNRRDLELGGARVLAYGHWGRPLLVFPSELGKRWDWEDNGMIGALTPLIDDGRLKVYCADGADAWTWRADDVPLEERARRHGDYERWITEIVAPFSTRTPRRRHHWTGGIFGAYHAANFTLKRADCSRSGSA